MARLPDVVEVAEPSEGRPPGRVCRHPQRDEAARLHLDVKLEFTVHFARQ